MTQHRCTVGAVTYLLAQGNSLSAEPGGLLRQVPGRNAELQRGHEGVQLRPAHHELVRGLLSKVGIASCTSKQAAQLHRQNKQHSILGGQGMGIANAIPNLGKSRGRVIWQKALPIMSGRQKG